MFVGRLNRQKRTNKGEMYEKNNCFGIGADDGIYYVWL